MIFQRTYLFEFPKPSFEIPNSIKTVVFFYHFLLLYNVFFKKKNPFILRLFILFTCLFLHFDFLVSKISKLTSGFSQKTYLYVFYIPLYLFWCIAIRVEMYVVQQKDRKKYVFFFLLIRFPKLTKILQVNYIFL